jgi:hypothetical protein
MTMLYPKESWGTFDFGAKVYDATGRRILHVSSCNPKTGEVIRNRHLSSWFWFGGFYWRPDPCSDSYLFLGIRWFRISTSYHYEIAFPLRHGFWPAPLRVVPRPVWNGDLEQLPRRSAAEREQLP